MKKIYIWASALLALTGCAQDDDNYNDQPVEAKFSATIDGSSTTRASDTSWDENDEIGITMVGRYNNFQYTTSSVNGLFEGNPMFFKNKRDAVTLTAYYPFTGTEGIVPGTEGIIEATTDAENQIKENQSKIDFLFAKKENVTGEDPNVKFEFAHKMCKLTLTFKNGNGADVSKINSYQIDGLALSGEFDTTTGDCSAKNTATPSPLAISLPAGTVSHGNEIPSLLLFPQAAAEGSVTLGIRDSDDQEFSCKLNFKNESLVGGNNYKWTITVNKAELVIENFTITDWKNEELDTDAGSVLQ